MNKSNPENSNESKLFNKKNSNLNETDSCKFLKEIFPKNSTKALSSSASTASSISSTKSFNMRHNNYNSKYNTNNSKYNNSSNNSSSYDHNNNSSNKKYTNSNSNNIFYTSNSSNGSTNRRNSYSNANNNYKFQKSNRHYVDNSSSAFAYKNNTNDASNYENRKQRKDTQSSTSSSSGQTSSKSSNLDSMNSNSKLTNANENYDDMDARSSTSPKDRKQTQQAKEQPKQGASNNPVTPIFNVNYKGHQFQPPPFQPAAYHHSNKLNLNSNSNHNNNFKINQTTQHHHNHNHFHHHNHHNHLNNYHTQHNQQLQQKNKILIEKYDRKYNLISFILLRKNDEYLVDNKYYLNDQSLYQQVDSLIEKRDLNGLMSLFLNEKLADKDEPENLSNYFNSLPNLSNFTNSYNCNLFVYTIRKCLENEHKMAESKAIDSILNEEKNFSLAETGSKNDSFLSDLIRFLFSKNVRPSSYYLIDGDYPKRNLIHYAARYNSDLIPELLLEGFKETNEEQEQEEEEGEEEEGDKSHHLLRFKNGEFVLAQLCMQTDFNESTPIHTAALNNSFKFFKLVNPICIKHSQFIYNEDGLNPFLLACRHSSVQFIQHLIQSFSKSSTQNDEADNDLRNLLVCVDKVYAKNCLHYACGRGYGKDALDVIQFLTKLAKALDEQASLVDLNNNSTNPNPNSKPIFIELIGSSSPLVGSVYHVAASNLTRLTTLWYLLNLYPSEGIYTPQDKKSVLDKLDFREFTTVDCLIDSVMNLREMAPSSCKTLAKFYDELLAHQKSQLERTLKYNDELSVEHEPTEFEDNFDVLLKRCVYKLLVEFKANINNLPRIRNQLQLIEFLKLMVFVSKFGGDYSSGSEAEFSVNAARFESIYCKNFEAFCLNFLNSFIFFGDVLPLLTTAKIETAPISNSNDEQKQTSQILTRNHSTSSNNSTSLAKTPPTSSSTSTSSGSVEELENLVEILTQLFELTETVHLNSVYKYSDKFKVKLSSFFSSYLSNLIGYHGFNPYFTASSFSPNESTSGSDSTDDETISNQSIDNTLNQVVNNSLELNSSSSIGSSASLTSLAKNSTSDGHCFRARIKEIKLKFEKLTSKETSPASLMNLCRNKINDCLLIRFNQYQTKKKLNVNQGANNDENQLSLSALSKNYLFFKLPSCYSSLVSFLTHDLVKDLYGGTNFDKLKLD